MKYNNHHLWGVNMAVDKALKMQDILSDYESALAKFENIDFLYQSHKDKFTITEEDDEQTITRKKARLNELLVDLGRVGELALKYIIKLKQLELYPNQTLEQFRKDALFKKGQVKSLALRQHLSEAELNALLNYEDINNQPFHNFDYLFMIIEKLMPEQAASFNKIIEYSMLSREIQKEPFSKDEKRNFEDVVFPEYTVRPMQDEEEEREVRERIINLRRNTIRESGDIFTRLRYFSINPHDKEFDFQSIYDLMKDIIMSIRTIHECNDDVEYDPIEGYAKIMALENPELTYRPAGELRDVFNLYKSKTDAYGLLGLLFSAKDYTFEQLKEITSMKEVQPKDYVTVFCNELKKEDIEFFLQHGITQGPLEEVCLLLITFCDLVNKGLPTLAAYITIDSMPESCLHCEVVARTSWPEGEVGEVVSAIETVDQVRVCVKLSSRDMQFACGILQDPVTHTAVTHLIYKSSVVLTQVVILDLTAVEDHKTDKVFDFLRYQDSTFVSSPGTGVVGVPAFMLGAVAGFLLIQYGKEICHTHLAPLKPGSRFIGPFRVVCFYEEHLIRHILV